MSDATTKEEILALTCKQHIKIHKLNKIGLKPKEIAEALSTNTGNVYNVLKEYASNPLKVEAAEKA